MAMWRKRKIIKNRRKEKGKEVRNGMKEKETRKERQGEGLDHVGVRKEREEEKRERKGGTGSDEREGKKK